MKEYTISETLHTGLLTLNRKGLISPNQEWPELFTDALDVEGVSSIESQARTALGTRGILASTDRFLVSPSNVPDKGYLLRESSTINVDEHGFAIYNYDEVSEFAHTHDEQDIHVHFLRQIAQHMRPVR